MKNKKTSEVKTKKTSFSKNTIIGLLLGLSIGFVAGFFINRKEKPHVKEEKQEYTLLRAGGYKFTSPLLDCENFKPSILRNHVLLKNNISTYIENTLKLGKADHISFYFRSLNNGPWIGVNENDNYSPASLLKLPIMIAVLKKAESEKSLLKKQIFFNKPIDTAYKANIHSKNGIRTGHKYSVEELMEYMVIYSDNYAKDLLLQLIGDEYLVNVFTDLGVDLKNRDINNDFISVKEYSSFYRVLYNSSYLSRNYSEKALEILSRTEFSSGIPDKLPKNVLVSHKFGERGLADSEMKQLHDCGIVYHKDTPYLLCIMTKGNDFNNLIKVISDISEIVYNSITTN